MITRYYFHSGEVHIGQTGKHFDGVAQYKSLFPRPDAVWRQVRKQIVDIYDCDGEKVHIQTLIRVV